MAWVVLKRPTVLFDRPLSGDFLPQGTLCLTYDDGPGPRTLELAQFLSEEQVPAAFFVIGQRARQQLSTLQRVESLGHAVANHAHGHVSLVGIERRGGDALQEVLGTHAFLRDALGDTPRLFRAPFGHWHEAEGQPSPLAARLGLHPELERCVGPVHWNINGNDWHFWRNQLSPNACARAYLDVIDKARRGIVLLHDDSAEAPDQPGNRCVELAKLLIPALRALGYRFIHVNDVPQLASAMRVSSRVRICASAGSLCEIDGALLVDYPQRVDASELGVIEVGGEKIVLRAPSGRYVSTNAGGGVSLTTDAGDSAVFTRILLEGAKVALQAAGGRYVTMSGRQLRADGTEVGPAETFTVEPY